MNLKKLFLFDLQHLNGKALFIMTVLLALLSLVTGGIALKVGRWIEACVLLPCGAALCFFAVQYKRKKNVNRLAICSAAGLFLHRRLIRP